MIAPKCSTWREKREKERREAIADCSREIEAIIRDIWTSGQYIWLTCHWLYFCKTNHLASSRVICVNEQVLRFGDGRNWSPTSPIPLSPFTWTRFRGISRTGANNLTGDCCVCRACSSEVFAVRNDVWSRPPSVPSPRWVWGRWWPPTSPAACWASTFYTSSAFRDSCCTYSRSVQRWKPTWLKTLTRDWNWNQKCHIWAESVSELYEDDGQWNYRTKLSKCREHVVNWTYLEISSFKNERTLFR